MSWTHLSSATIASPRGFGGFGSSVSATAIGGSCLAEPHIYMYAHAYTIREQQAGRQ